MRKTLVTSYSKTMHNKHQHCHSRHDCHILDTLLKQTEERDAKANSQASDKCFINVCLTDKKINKND